MLGTLRGIQSSTDVVHCAESGPLSSAGQSKAFLKPRSAVRIGQGSHAYAHHLAVEVANGRMALADALDLAAWGGK